MSRRETLRRVVNLIAFAIGAVALAFITDRLGWQRIRDVIARAGPWFAVMAVIDLASVACDAYAIYSLLERSVRFRHVFAAQASGLAINRVTPGNSLGEPVKVTMLARHVELGTAVGAVVMLNLTTMYVSITAIAIGVPVTASLIDLSHTASMIAWIGLGVLIALAIVVAVLVRRGAFATGIALLSRLGAISDDRAARWRARSLDIDVHLRKLGDLREPSVRGGIAGVLGSRVCNWIGTIVVLRATGIEMTAPLVVAMLSVGILVTWISNVIPLGLGIADGTNYALYAMLGASSQAGLVFTLVNRVRTCGLALMGLTIMLIARLG